ncbi:MAG TPA: M1 family metallopeptidase [Vicinamibacterales bacterium]|nr:M1 family metallopeptidase [Vicinamibacterales bacterium]
MRSTMALALGVLISGSVAGGQQPAPPLPPSTLRAPSRAEVIKGDYGRYRANNDLLHYDLDIKVDPDKKWLGGTNTIRFKMLKDDTRIQLDLVPYMNVERINEKGSSNELKYGRDLTAVYIDFPSTLRAGRTYEIEFQYSGNPVETGRFDGFAFKKDAAGNHWINTANEGEGASLWWPCKDQWRDEPEGMEIKIAVPSELTNVSNGRFIAKTDLGDGFTKWHYRVHYPINAYNVSVNAARYVHFGEKMGDLTLDYYVLPGSLEKAKKQFAQAKPMIEAFEKYFGEYPFKKDGFKLIEVPYSGMEHQSAVTYGNRFANGYLERDWTGVGVSLKFDFIIIHESAHEWFGNAVSAADQADMWIHEAWATYLECLYVEHVFGYDDALKYTNGYKSKVANAEPIVVQRGIYRSPNQDQYFKGALFLHTLRSVVNDDAKWWKLLRDLYAEFKYRNIFTEDLVAFVNRQLGQDLTPIFDQYLRRAALPVLEVTYHDTDQTIAYRWNAAERGFAMPLKVEVAGKPMVITPATTHWQMLPGGADELRVPVDRYFIEVASLDARGRPIKP